MIKKIIRGILKVPLTPFILIWFVWWYIIISVSQFVDWVYNENFDEWDCAYLRKQKKESIKFMKKWFTTV